ncbi:NUDIX hydrolase [Microbacterium capsulatum]|uniref:NUDIX hydrolase n=1 Tax=Microbacterium capsulatum TaxID=3041921 RepID=A0ABU0XJM8_9MICO|nr:NUDIX hydrolase [Microbacterium sp. ASV81]MDQ4215351.1 NUDIX hydrolase [Microbacterium sp. ASV81]
MSGERLVRARRDRSRPRLRASNPGEPRWHWLATRELHRGRVRIDADEVELPSGERTVFEVDRSIPFSVATLILDGEHVLVSRQYRYAIDRWILDLPGGAGRSGEAPEAAARRELAEELGLAAGELLPLHTFFPSPGRSVWATHLFLAARVRPGRAAQDDRPGRVQQVRMSLAELDGLISAGEIVDPPLLVARTMAAAKGLLPPIGA